MQNKSIYFSTLLWLTAAVWGFSFVAQRSGMQHIGPFLFNGIRFLLGSLSLIPLLFISKINKPHSHIKTSISNGITLGSVLFIAASLQQIGMKYTTAAHGGFITSLYVIIVPI